jgi:uncharacterized RDD family membrane protein YckC
VGAALVDILAIVGISTILAAAAVTALRATHSMPSGGVRLVLAVASFAVWSFYGPLLMARAGERNGQTWGKQLLGVRVVRELRGPMTLATGLAREAIGKQLLTFITGGIYAPLDYAWALWDPERQALHDKVADTLVVVAQAPAAIVEGLPTPEHWLPPRPGA